MTNTGLAFPCGAGQRARASGSNTSRKGAPSTKREHPEHATPHGKKLQPREEPATRVAVTARHDPANRALTLAITETASPSSLPSVEPVFANSPRFGTVKTRRGRNRKTDQKLLQSVPREPPSSVSRVCKISVTQQGP